MAIITSHHTFCFNNMDLLQVRGVQEILYFLLCFSFLTRIHQLQDQIVCIKQQTPAYSVFYLIPVQRCMGGSESAFLPNFSLCGTNQIILQLF